MSAKDSIGLPFTVFRASGAMDYADAECMTPQPISDTALHWSQRLTEAGMLEGSTVKLLFSRPGLSLTYVWFKSRYPLPRHSHDADCTYFVIAGALKIGTEELGPGDGFFVGKDVPYTYTPGPEGVEVLEVRTANRFDIKLLANNPAWWERALGTVAEAREGWESETPPSGMVVG